MRDIVANTVARREAIFNFRFEVEHIVPQSRGGTDDQGNLALACRSCNVSKSNHVTGAGEANETDEADGGGGDFAERLFDPRRDTWESHFSVGAETGLIEPVTTIGRGTVARLRMNSDVHLAARLQWMRLGLFP